jgi:hypothetical protein
MIPKYFSEVPAVILTSTFKTRRGTKRGSLSYQMSQFSDSQ